MSLTPARPEHLTNQLLRLSEGHPTTNVLRTIQDAASDYRLLLIVEISKPNATAVYPSVEPTVVRTDQNTITFEFDGFKVSFEDHYPFVLVTPSNRDTYPLCWGANGLALSEAVTDEIHWGIFRYLGHDIAVPPNRPT
jgi:hypothetical protein